MQDPSHICNLCYSLQQYQILNPLSRPGIELTSSGILVGFWTHWAGQGSNPHPQGILGGFLTHWATMRTPAYFFQPVFYGSLSVYIYILIYINEYVNKYPYWERRGARLSLMLFSSHHNLGDHVQGRKVKEALCCIPFQHLLNVESFKCIAYLQNRWKQNIIPSCILHSPVLRHSVHSS